MNTNSIYLGLSGVVLPYPKYKYPSEFQNISRLSIYATYFNSIEINESFYKIPKQKTIERWSTSVPEKFRFTFKLHQELTHCKFLDYDPRHVAHFVDVISTIDVKSACVLVQFPPSLKSNCLSQLENLLNDLKASIGSRLWNIAVEFRDAGWYNDDTFDLLKTQNASLVLHDIPKSAAPFTTTSDEFVYVRFHGPTGTYRGSYSEIFLREWAEYVNEWANEGKNAYVYFNNTAGSAFENARAFQTMLQGSNGK